MKKLGEMTTQELDNKLRLRWALIALIFLACAILQSNLALAACDSFEPYGSCPETNFAIRPSESYYNNVSFSNSTTGTSVQSYFR